jgi:hypothetical protein
MIFTPTVSCASVGRIILRNFTESLAAVKAKNELYSERLNPGKTGGFCLWIEAFDLTE